MVLNSSASDKQMGTGPSMPAVWQWGTLCFGLVGLMALAAAHLPPGWQRPGPTAFWFAIVSGLVVGGIAVVHRVYSGRWVFVLGFLVISLAIAGMTGERYRLYDKTLRDLYLGPATAQNPQAMQDRLQHGHVEEQLMQEHRQSRRRVYEARRSFPVFLKFRLEGWGLTNDPWPIVFWWGEILIGGLLGAFIALRWHTWQREAQQTAGNLPGD
jgi:hypothetical protein